MKLLLTAALLSTAIFSFGQGHDTLKGAGINDISFLVGNWHGSQDFNTGGPPLVGKIVDRTHEVVGGRYLEEQLATTMPGKKPTDVRHFITFDAKAKLYKAWWFNDTSVGPMELEGTLDKNKLVLQTPAGGPEGAPVFRATYVNPSPNTLDYTFELQTPTGWRLLFTSKYKK